MAHEHASLEAFDEIPDPAAGVARGPVPEPPAPVERALTRQERSLRGALALGGALAWIGALVAVFGLRPDIRAPAAAIPLAVWAALAAAGLALAHRPAARGLPPSVTRLRAVALAVPLGFVLAALASTRLSEEAPEGTFLPCLLTASLLALAPLALAAVVLRRSFLSAPAWRGAAVGAICGLGGALGIHAHCPQTASAHVVLAHGFPVLFGAVLGAVAGAARGRV